MGERQPRPTPEPEPQGPAGAEASPEQVSIESEHVANKKLEKLMSPEFNDFALRFVNINEYRDIMTRDDGKVVGGGGEVYIPKKDEGEDKKRSFQEYLKSHSGESARINWIYTVEHATMAESPARGMGAYHRLLTKLQLGARQDYKTGERFRRDEAVERLRSEILERSAVPSAGADFTLIQEAQDFPERREQLNQSIEEMQQLLREDSYQRIISKIEETIDEEINRNQRQSRMGVSEITELVKDIGSSEAETKRIHGLASQVYETKRQFAWYGGQQNLEVASQFLKDPNFLKKRENRRALFNAIAYANQPDKRSNWRHYHIALVYSTKPVRSHPETSSKMYGILTP